MRTTSDLEESLKSDPDPAENESKELCKQTRAGGGPVSPQAKPHAHSFHSPLGHPHERALNAAILIIDCPNELLRGSGLTDCRVRAESSIGLELMVAYQSRTEIKSQYQQSESQISESLS